MHNDYVEDKMDNRELLEGLVEKFKRLDSVIKKPNPKMDDDRETLIVVDAYISQLGEEREVSVNEKAFMTEFLRRRIIDKEEYNIARQPYEEGSRFGSWLATFIGAVLGGVAGSVLSGDTLIGGLSSLAGAVAGYGSSKIPAALNCRVLDREFEARQGRLLSEYANKLEDPLGDLLNAYENRSEEVRQAEQYDGEEARMQFISDYCAEKGIEATDKENLVMVGFLGRVCAMRSGDVKEDPEQVQYYKDRYSKCLREVASVRDTDEAMRLLATHNFDYDELFAAAKSAYQQDRLRGGNNCGQLLEAVEGAFTRDGNKNPQQAAYGNMVVVAGNGNPEGMIETWKPVLEEYREKHGLEEVKLK